MAVTNKFETFWWCVVQKLGNFLLLTNFETFQHGDQQLWNFLMVCCSPNLKLSITWHGFLLYSREEIMSHRGNRLGLFCLCICFCIYIYICICNGGIGLICRAKFESFLAFKGGEVLLTQIYSVQLFQGNRSWSEEGWIEAATVLYITVYNVRIVNAVQCHSVFSDHFDCHDLKFSETLHFEVCKHFWNLLFFRYNLHNRDITIKNPSHFQITGHFFACVKACECDCVYVFPKFVKKNILGPNIFGPKLTQPERFYTDFTRRLRIFRAFANSC